MVRNYGLLCRNVLASPVFKGYEAIGEKVKVLVSDLKGGTQYNYLVTFKKYLEFARDKGVTSPLKFDLVLVKQFLTQYNATSRSGQAFRLRRILQWNGEAAKFKVKSVDNDLPEVLSEHEINQLVKAASSLMWKAVIRVTYEGALRNHEVMGLRVRHVRFDKFGAEVYVPSTKSQSLWLRMIDSVPLLQGWMEQHPEPEDREAWLFPGRIEGQRLAETAFYLCLQRTAVRAGIRKKVTPHILRHSRLAWLKKFGVKIGISDSVICKLYGRWSRKNAHRMLDRYGRIEPSEANDIVLKAYGKLDRGEVKESLVKPQVCPRCKCENDALARYCRHCGVILDLKAAQRQMKRDQILDDLLDGLKKNGKLEQFIENNKEL